MPRHRTATPVKRAKPAPCEHLELERHTRLVVVDVELVEPEVDEDAEAALIAARCDKARTVVDDGEGGTRPEADGEILERIPELRPERPRPVAKVTREPREVALEVEVGGRKLNRCAKCRAWLEAKGGA